MAKDETNLEKRAATKAAEVDTLRNAVATAQTAFRASPTPEAVRALRNAETALEAGLAELAPLEKAAAAERKARTEAELAERERREAKQREAEAAARAEAETQQLAAVREAFPLSDRTAVLRALEAAIEPIVNAAAVVAQVDADVRRIIEMHTQQAAEAAGLAKRLGLPTPPPAEEALLLRTKAMAHVLVNDRLETVPVAKDWITPAAIRAGDTKIEGVRRSALGFLTSDPDQRPRLTRSEHYVLLLEHGSEKGSRMAMKLDDERKRRNEDAISNCAGMGFKARENAVWARQRLEIERSRGGVRSDETREYIAQYEALILAAAPHETPDAIRKDAEHAAVELRRLEAQGWQGYTVEERTNLKRIFEAVLEEAARLDGAGK